MDAAEWFREIGLPMYARRPAAGDASPAPPDELAPETLAAWGVLEEHRHRVLEELAAATRRDRTPLAAPEAERRQLTLLCADLVGSTRLAEDIDPEDFRELLRTYQEILTVSVTEHEGHVATLAGDGVMACFGYPVAHEDEAERAVLAALRALEVIAEVNPSLERRVGARIDVRLAVHTGFAVIGRIGSDIVEDSSQIIGPAPNLVSRLQAEAEPGTLAVSGQTLQLIRNRFRHAFVGERQLRGVPHPVQVHRIDGPRPAAPAEADDGGASALLGREAEVDRLLQLWNRAAAGDGVAAVLSGDPGIGKSRLLRAFRERLGEGPRLTHVYHCSARHVNTALFPVTENLSQQLLLQSGDDMAARQEKLLRNLDLHGLPPDQVLPYLAALLSLDPPPSFPLPDMTPRQLKLKTLETLLRLAEAASAVQPVLIVVEDLHWADPSTRQLVDMFVRRVPDMRAMLICSVRNPPGSPWAGEQGVETIELRRLNEAEARALSLRVAGAQALPEPALRQLILRAEGNPLFVEELTKGYLSGGDAGDDAVPASLRDALTARLDRLGEAKEVAQFCSVLGRTFRHDVLLQASPFARDRLERGLAALKEADLLLEHRGDGGAFHEFKHALIQDAAHGTLLKSRRRALHRHSAQVLELAYPEVANRQPELLAQHYAQAGEAARAIELWQQAGRKAIDRSANAEAAALLRKALELIAEVPPASAQQELMTLIWLGSALTAMHGYAHEEVGRTYSRAREICASMGEAAQIFPVMSGLYRFYFVRSELDSALDVTRRMMEIAERTGSPDFLVEAHRSIGLCLCYQGRPQDGVAHLDRSLALFDPARDADHRFVYGTDRKVASLAVRATQVLLLGRPQESLRDIAAALSRARELAHPFTEAWTASFAAVQFDLLGDHAACAANAERAMEISARHDFAFWHAAGRIMLGSARFSEGVDPAGAVRLMEEGLRDWRAVGAEMYRPYWIIALARAYHAVGRGEEALRLLDLSLAEQTANGQRWMEAETHRLRAVILCASAEGETGEARRAEARAALGAAIAVARSQGAELLELRARMTLVDLSAALRVDPSEHRETIAQQCAQMDLRGAGGAVAGARTAPMQFE